MSTGYGDYPRSSGAKEAPRRAEKLLRDLEVQIYGGASLESIGVLIDLIGFASLPLHLKQKYWALLAEFHRRKITEIDQLVFSYLHVDRKHWYVPFDFSNLFILDDQERDDTKTEVSECIPPEEENKSGAKSGLSQFVASRDDLLAQMKKIRILLSKSNPLNNANKLQNFVDMLSEIGGVSVPKNIQSALESAQKAIKSFEDSGLKSGTNPQTISVGVSIENLLSLLNELVTNLSPKSSPVHTDVLSDAEKNSLIGLKKSINTLLDDGHWGLAVDALGRIPFENVDTDIIDRLKGIYNADKNKHTGEIKNIGRTVINLERKLRKLELNEKVTSSEHAELNKLKVDLELKQMALGKLDNSLMGMFVGESKQNVSSEPLSSKERYESATGTKLNKVYESGETNVYETEDGRFIIHIEKNELAPDLEKNNTTMFNDLIEQMPADLNNRLHEADDRGALMKWQGHVPEFSDPQFAIDYLKQNGIFVGTYDELREIKKNAGDALAHMQIEHIFAAANWGPETGRNVTIPGAGNMSEGTALCIMVHDAQSDGTEHKNLTILQKTIARLNKLQGKKMTIKEWQGNLVKNHVESWQDDSVQRFGEYHTNKEVRANKSLSISNDDIRKGSSTRSHIEAKTRGAALNSVLTSHFKELNTNMSIELTNKVVR